jgi:tetratricopeptide (TPR) repeat protein
LKSALPPINELSENRNPEARLTPLRVEPLHADGLETTTNSVSVVVLNEIDYWTLRLQKGMLRFQEQAVERLRTSQLEHTSIEFWRELALKEPNNEILVLEVLSRDIKFGGVQPWKSYWEELIKSATDIKTPQALIRALSLDKYNKYFTIDDTVEILCVILKQFPENDPFYRALDNLTKMHMDTHGRQSLWTELASTLPDGCRGQKVAFQFMLEALDGNRLDDLGVLTTVVSKYPRSYGFAKELDKRLDSEGGRNLASSVWQTLTGILPNEIIFKFFQCLSNGSDNILDDLKEILVAVVVADKEIRNLSDFLDDFDIQLRSYPSAESVSVWEHAWLWCIDNSQRKSLIGTKYCAAVARLVEDKGYVMLKMLQNIARRCPEQVGRWFPGKVNHIYSLIGDMDTWIGIWELVITEAPEAVWPRIRLAEIILQHRGETQQTLICLAGLYQNIDSSLAVVTIECLVRETWFVQRQGAFEFWERMVRHFPSQRSINSLDLIMRWGQFQYGALKTIWEDLLNLHPDNETISIKLQQALRAFLEDNVESILDYWVKFLRKHPTKAVTNRIRDTFRFSSDTDSCAILSATDTYEAEIKFWVAELWDLPNKLWPLRAFQTTLEEYSDALVLEKNFDQVVQLWNGADKFCEDLLAQNPLDLEGPKLRGIVESILKIFSRA